MQKCYMNMKAHSENTPHLQILIGIAQQLC